MYGAKIFVWAKDILYIKLYIYVNNCAVNKTLKYGWNNVCVSFSYIFIYIYLYFFMIIESNVNLINDKWVKL